MKISTAEFGALFEDDVERALKHLKAPWKVYRNVILPVRSDTHQDKEGNYCAGRIYRYIQYDFVLVCYNHVVILECKNSTARKRVLDTETGNIISHYDSGSMISINAYKQVQTQYDHMSLFMHNCEVVFIEVIKTRGSFSILDNKKPSEVLNKKVYFYSDKRLKDLILNLNSSIKALGNVTCEMFCKDNKHLIDLDTVQRMVCYSIEANSVSNEVYIDYLKCKNAYKGYKSITVTEDDIKSIDYFEICFFECEGHQLSLFPQEDMNKGGKKRGKRKRVNFAESGNACNTKRA